MQDSGKLPGRPGRPPGIQRDPQNRLNFVFLVKKRVPNVDSLSIFVHKAVFRSFSTSSLRFFTKNRRKVKEKRYVLFHNSACFFEHGDPHETSYFTIRKLLFHFSCFGIFHQKNIEKVTSNAENNFGPPNPPKMVPGDPFWVPKWSWIHVGDAKNP